jgi:hypothetical protein
MECVEELAHEFAQGRYVKAGIKGICSDLGKDAGEVIPHELFVECGSCDYYTGQRLVIAGTRRSRRTGSPLAVLHRRPRLTYAAFRRSEIA